MYCASCGEEIDETKNYCPDCGHEIGTDPVSSSVSEDVGEPVSEDSSATDDGVDYDFVMSIEDGLRRRTPLRLILDIITFFATAGIWGGWLVVEFITHHYNLNKGETEPYEEGDERTFNIM